MAEIGLYAGGFKPPHKGHYGIAKRMRRQNNKSIILGSVVAPRPLPGGGEITGAVSKKFWQQYLKTLPSRKYVPSKFPSPIVGTFQYLSGLPRGTSVNIYFGQKDRDRNRKWITPPMQKIKAGTYVDKKGNRWPQLDVQLKYLDFQRGGQPISSTKIRQRISNDDFQTFKSMIPRQVTGSRRKLWGIARKSIQQVMQVNADAQSLTQAYQKIIDQQQSIVICEAVDAKGAITHLQHLQDYIINQGKPGFLKFAKRVQRIMQSQGGEGLELSQKIDGRPRIIFGTDPRNGQFFVGTKSVARKRKPKINHSQKQIQRNHGDVPGLAQKLKRRLPRLRSVYAGDGVYQCDALFSPGDKKTQSIGKQKFITFKPNVITYAVPIDRQSQLRKDVRNAQFGAVIHTQYSRQSNPQGTGLTLKQVPPDFDQIIRNAQVQPSIFLTDPFHQSITDITIPQQRKKKIQQQLQRIGTMISGIDSKRWVKGKTRSYIKMYLNSQLRTPSGGIFGAQLGGQKFDFNKLSQGYKQWVASRKRDTQSRKDLLMQQWDRNAQNISNLLHAFYKMLQIKNILLKAFASIKSKIGNTYTVKDDALQVVKPQGFVVITSQGVVKMIDRLQFSKNNFLAGRFQKAVKKQSYENFKQLVLQRLIKKLDQYFESKKKLLGIISRSKRLMQGGKINKGLSLIQQITTKYGCWNRCQQLLEQNRQCKSKAALMLLQRLQKNIRDNNVIKQGVDIDNILIDTIQDKPEGFNALLLKDWEAPSPTVKALYDILQQLNKRFVQTIQGVFRSSNFILNWQRTKAIVMKAALDVREQQDQTTTDNILNQLYDKINQSGDIEQPSQRIKKIAYATKKYADSVTQLTPKIKKAYQQKIIDRQTYKDIFEDVEFIKHNLQKISEAYPELILLTSETNKGKFYINLLLLFWGSKKKQDIQQIINSIDDYNPAITQQKQKHQQQQLYSAAQQKKKQQQEALKRDKQRRKQQRQRQKQRKKDQIQEQKRALQKQKLQKQRQDLQRQAITDKSLSKSIKRI